MSVFIRKFEPGGVAKLSEGSDVKTGNENYTVHSPKFIIGDYQINTNDFIKDLENNFLVFQNVYGGTWTNREREDIIRDHLLFIQNVRNGNITGIDSSGRFDVVDPGFAGIDFSTDGAWGRYSYYVKQIADAERIGEVATEQKPKNKFTSTSILKDIHNTFFGGVENPDYQSFFDLDEVVERDGKKVRGVRNRVNALLDLLNENYMSKFDDADESLGGLEGARERVDRLRKALSDGTLNNEDYASAAALGLNLRGLLSTDGNITFDTNGGISSSTSESTATTEGSLATATEQLRELVYGKKESSEDLLARINRWDSKVNNTYNLGVDLNFRANDYLNERAKTRNEDLKYISSYYRNLFFPLFFENLKTLTPEYLLLNSDKTVPTWQGDLKVSDYVRINLTLAIRNKLYGDDAHALLSDSIYNELNQIIGTNYWTVPRSFDEETGTILLFDPNTGDYKRVSINNRSLKFISPVDKKEHTLLEDYLYGKQVSFAKNGAKLQLGGNINSLMLNQLTEDQRDEAFVSKMTSYVEASKPAKHSGHTTIEKEESDYADDTHASQVITGKGSADWETEDYARLVSLGADLVSLAGGYVGLGAGLASTVSDIVGDSADESLTGWDVAKNAGINTAWTIAGLVPGVKLGKIGKALLSWGPRGFALLNASGLIRDEHTYDALRRMFTTGKVTSSDLNILTQLGRAITGSVGMGKAIKRGHIYKKGKSDSIGKEVVLKKEGADDLKVIFNNEELNKINKAGQESGQTAANEKVREILKNKGMNEAESKKMSLKKETFKEGDSHFTKFARSKKEVKGKKIYPEQSQAHYDYVHEKYGKWMGIENDGEGVSGFNLGLKDKYDRAKGAILGDAAYNRYMEANSPHTNETSGRSTSSEGGSSEGGSASRTGGAEEPRTRSTEEPKTETSGEAKAAEEPKAEGSKGAEKPEAKGKSEGESKSEESKGKDGASEEPLEKKTEELVKEKTGNAKDATNKNTNNIYRRSYLRKLAKESSTPEKVAKDLENYLNSLEPKKRVSKKEIDKILNRVQLAIPFNKQGSKLDKIRFYKTAIPMAKEGDVADWFASRYPLKQLGNVELKSRNLKANTSVLNKHNEDFTLYNPYVMNDYYVGTSGLVGKDLQDYINNSETLDFKSLEDFVNQYNLDAKSIRDTWDYGSNEVTHNHMANTQSGMTAHNRLFKRMFNSRSQSNNNNSNYNIGYQDDLEDTMGTSTWMRRMDQYQNEFDLNKLKTGGLDEQGYSRIHKIKLRNGTEGYVYKKANGDIGVLDNETAMKILGENGAAGNGAAGTGTGTGTGTGGTGTGTGAGGTGNGTGNDIDWEQVMKILGGNSGVGTAGRGTDYYQYLPAAVALGRMISDNEATRRRTDEYLSKLQVPLQQPWQFHRQVYGDYSSLKEAENQATAIRNKMDRPSTSNAQLALLGKLEGERLASEQLWRGQVADNQMIHKTAEMSANEQKDNIKRATDVANVNRSLMAEDAKYRAGVRAAADTTIHNNLDNWLMNYVEKPIQEEANRRKAYQDYYDYISLGPMEYDFTSDPVIMDAQIRLSKISDTDPQRDAKRQAIIKEVEAHRLKKINEYKLNQLIRFRQLYPYIRQRIPLELYAKYSTTGSKVPSTATTPIATASKAKGGILDSKYPTAVIRAKSKDNDRLIKQVLEIIRNHKDLAKGVRTIDYSKYTIKDLK